MATVYVATDGIDAGGRGAIGSPYASISYANSQVGTSGEIIVRGGTYTAQAQVTVSIATGGTAGTPAWIHNYTGEKPIIDGSNCNSNGNGVVFINANYVTFEGIEVENALSGTGGRMGIYVYGCNHVTLLNCKIHDTYTAGISIGDPGMAALHDVTVQGCEVYYASKNNQTNPGSAVWANGIQVYAQAYSTPSANMVVTQNSVHQCWGEGIDFIGVNGGSCTQNVVWDAFSIGIYNDGSKNITYDRNLIYYTGDAAFKRYDNAYEPEGFSISTETAGQGSDSCTVSNNIIIGTRRGIRSFETSTFGVRNFTIINNTVVNCNVAQIQIDTETGTTGNLLRNNLSYRSPSGTGGAGSATGFTFDHNAWYGGAGGPFAGGTGDITNDPLLVAPGTRSAPTFDPLNVKITNGSPCKDAGSSTSAPNHDYWNVARALGAGYDIGASEFGKTATIYIQDEAYATLANQSSIHWAWWDRQDVAAIAEAPVAKGNAETTDANGRLFLDVSTSALSSGQQGILLAHFSDESRSEIWLVSVD